MTTHEVAEYLRIKERKVYDLVREKKIPCTRVTGKRLFPKHLIDHWLAEGTAAGTDTPTPPPVVAGSHDPLLEWALRESGCGLAMLAGGSLDGLKRLVAGEAAVAGLHVLDEDTGQYNRPAVEPACAGLGVVLIEWARRQQGLVLAPGNPLGIQSVADLGAKKARVVTRQDGAGSQILLLHLFKEAGLDADRIDTTDHPARNETDLGLAVQDGKADVGLAVAAVAKQYRLDFVPIQQERYDLLVRRRDYFEEPFQTLLAFARTDSFKTRSAEMVGYDVNGLGRVRFNG